MDVENRRLFEIGKTAAMSQALIDGYSAVLSSYKEGTKVGGPIAGAAFAATAAVATGAQIAKISSQSYGSGGSVSSPSGGDTNVPQQQGGGQTQQSVNLNLSLVGDSFSRSQVMGLGREMVDEINNALDDGAQLRVTGT